MADKRFPDNPLGSPSHAFAVVPDDNVELVQIPRALWIGGAGNVVLRFADDTAEVTLTGVPAGTLLSVQVKLVKATGTTATGIVAMS
jgi:hypothetical protein